MVKQGLDNGPVNALLAVDGGLLCGVLGWGVYRTDENGTIRLTSDGVQLWFESER